MIKRFWESGLVLLVLLTIAGLTMAGGEVYRGITDRTADSVIGQPGFYADYSGTSDTMINGPFPGAVDHSGNLWVGDYSNRRILKFNASDGVVSDTTADLVLGQASFFTSYGGISDTLTNSLYDLAFDPNGNLYVLDVGNRRVLRFDADTVTELVTDTTADLVFGQASFFTNYAGTSDTMIYGGEGGLDVDRNGNLYLSDYPNNRIVRWNADSDGTLRDTTIDFVIGQAGYYGSYVGLSDTQLTGPLNLAFDGSGNMYMTSYDNNRVLRWDASSTGVVNDTTADLVIGQASFFTNYSGLSDTMFTDPYGAEVDSLNNLWVFDFSTNRILRFDAGGDTTADFVIGGGDPNGGFDSGLSGLSDTMFNNPYLGCFSPNGQLYVMDYSNNRILRFGAFWDVLGDDDDCFLATAAYGHDAEELGAFHQFRDEVLLQSSIGRGLVSFYYTHGPSAASYIAGDASRFVTRTALTPVLGLVKLINLLGTFGTLAVLILIVLGFLSLRDRFIH